VSQKQKKRGHQRRKEDHNGLSDYNKRTHIRDQFNETGSWDYSVSKTNTSYQIDFGNNYKFQVIPNLPEHQAIQFLGTTDQKSVDHTTRDHLIRNQIKPMVRAWKGSLVFHASAVSINNACWGFIGNSGAGKSTLAKSLTCQSSIDHWSDDWLEVQEKHSKHHVLFNSFSTRLESTHAQELVRAKFIDSPTSNNLSVGKKLLLHNTEDKLSLSSISRAVFEFVTSKRKMVTL
jgi:hypothetical protein